MYCKKCGAEIGDDSVFCSKCGAAQDNTDASVSAANKVNINKNAEKEAVKADPKKVKIGVIIQLAGLIISVIGTVLYLFLWYYVGLISAIVGCVLAIGGSVLYRRGRKSPQTDSIEIKKKMKLGRLCEIVAGIILILLGVSIGILDVEENKLKNEAGSEYRYFYSSYEHDKWAFGYFKNLSRVQDDYKFVSTCNKSKKSAEELERANKRYRDAQDALDALDRIERSRGN